MHAEDVAGGNVSVQEPRVMERQQGSTHAEPDPNGLCFKQMSLGLEEVGQGQGPVRIGGSNPLSRTIQC